MTLDEDLYALWKAQAVGLASMLLVHASLWVPLMSDDEWIAFDYKIASLASIFILVVTLSLIVIDISCFVGRWCP